MEQLLKQPTETQTQSVQPQTQRAIQLSSGEVKDINLNWETGHIVLKEQTNLQLRYIAAEEEVPFELNTPVAAPLNFGGLLLIEALSAGNHTAKLVHLLPDGRQGEELTIQTYDLRVGLSIDSNRDGQIDDRDIGRASWVYGEAQQGAILLINNDLDISDQSPELDQKSEWSELMIEPTGVEDLPAELSFTLHIHPVMAECCAVYMKGEDGQVHHILGKDLKDLSAPARLASTQLPAKGATCFIEAHKYPKDLFDAIISLDLKLTFGDEVIATDRAIYRVAPWIMMPNTLAPAEVYVCETEDNEQFVSELEAALDEISVPLKVISKQQNRGDRWIQDEVEFGYMQGVAHTMPVVFDSPRDRELDDFPEISLLGPDFGHFQIGNNSRNSLDSFGNLEVSPPVTASGRHYPFGRIVIGGRRRGDYSDASRQMLPELRHFLYAQRIQAPFEIYTDWLGVGHVDEIICFVPAQNNKGFQVLVASPQNAHIILSRLADRGYGDTVMFEGMNRRHPDSSENAEITIAELLSDEAFWAANQRYQRYMNLNIEILRKELGISGQHIVNIPVLFHPAPAHDYTTAYFPDMINHLVLGETSIVPKPKGPIINGKCAFEEAFEEAVPNRKVHFIDDWYTYHELAGEIHCGTNTRRHPFPNERWWHHKPDGGFDI